MLQHPRRQLDVEAPPTEDSARLLRDQARDVLGALRQQLCRL
jgi:hypothetical protein